MTRRSCPRWCSAPLAALVALAAAACAGAQPALASESEALAALAAGPSPELGAGPADDGANLALQVSPDDAEIYVDGVLQGTAAQLGGRVALRVAPGQRRVEVRKAGLRPWTATLDVPAEGRQRVSVTLTQ